LTLWIAKSRDAMSRLDEDKLMSLKATSGGPKRRVRNPSSKHYHLSSEYIIKHMVMQENGERIKAMVALALEPYRDEILAMHKNRKKRSRYYEPNTRRVLVR